MSRAAARPPTRSLASCVMMPSRYGVVWVYSDIRARMRTHRTSRRLTNRTDVTGPAATGIHPNCIRSLRDTASRLPRVDTLRRSSLPKFHDLAECGPRALAAHGSTRSAACLGRARWARWRRRGRVCERSGAAAAARWPLRWSVLAKAAPSEAARSWRGKRRGAADRAAVRVDGATGIRLPRGRRL